MENTNEQETAYTCTNPNVVDGMMICDGNCQACGWHQPLPNLTMKATDTQKLSVWHDSSKEQPKQGSDVIVLEGHDGTVMNNVICVSEAYIDDIIESIESDDLDEAAKTHSMYILRKNGMRDEVCFCSDSETSFKAGAEYQRKKDIKEINESFKKGYSKGRSDVWNEIMRQ